MIIILLPILLFSSKSDSAYSCCAFTLTVAEEKFPIRLKGLTSNSWPCWSLLRVPLPLASYSLGNLAFYFTGNTEAIRREFHRYHHFNPLTSIHIVILYHPAGSHEWTWHAFSPLLHQGTRFHPLLSIQDIHPLILLPLSYIMNFSSLLNFKMC